MQSIRRGILGVKMPTLESDFQKSGVDSLLGIIFDGRGCESRGCRAFPVSPLHPVWIENTFMRPPLSLPYCNYP